MNILKSRKTWTIPKMKHKNNNNNNSIWYCINHIYYYNILIKFKDEFMNSQKEGT